MHQNTMTLQTCSRCQASIPSHSGGDLCPACMMSQALAAPDDPTLDREPEWVPQAVPEADEAESLDLGDYRLLRPLGRGGMARVFEAEHLPSGRRVALKRLGHRLDNADMRQRFLREGRLAARVSHPHSLYVFGSEDAEGVPIITMEIAQGGTLQDELDARGPLPVEEAVDAALDVIAGLEAAQAVGVLHRDVKPSNCFVGPDGAVKIGDYGLSVSCLERDDSYATKAGTLMGTPAFASPEQLRGDELDHRADIYSVGATLFTLLTDQAPFNGLNAVQVVANVVHEAPKSLRKLRPELPPELVSVVERCLAKEPEARFPTYAELRRALLRFSSSEPEPVPAKARAAAGWMDFLLALFVPYVVLVAWVGSSTFHFGWFMERTFESARYYLILVACAVTYFTVAEGLFGAGVGKRRKGLQVVRTDGGRPGPLRALVRILAPIAAIEVVRLPLLFTFMTARNIEEMTGFQILFYTAVTTLTPWIAVLSELTEKRSNGFASAWDLLSGTRVIFRPKDVERPQVDVAEATESEANLPPRLGPYTVDGEVVAYNWLEATDPVLRRPVWLLRRQGDGPSEGRRDVARPGRLRWLQKVAFGDAVWDAYEALPGAPWAQHVDPEGAVPWRDARHWLHDLTTEIRAASAEGTLPSHLSLDHVWLTSEGRAVLLDTPWPHADGSQGGAPASSIPVHDVAGQQRFLSTVAERIERRTLPLHARSLLQNLEHGRFEKLSFLAGTLQGLLERPVDLNRWVRAGALFMLPLYNLVMVRVGSQENVEPLQQLVAGTFGSVNFFVVLVILGFCALAQLACIPFRTTTGHALFRLVVVDAAGQRATRRRLLMRWAVAWLPLALALGLTVGTQGNLASPWAWLWVAAWFIGAVHTAWAPHQGLHDRLAGTWVVRR